MNIAFIPARGASKSIPLKNIKELCGKPLIYWNVEALQNTPEIDKVVVATDHPEIKKTANSFGFSKVEVFDRDAENAQDKSSTEAVILEYLNKANLAKDDMFILVQATSPLTRAEHFSSAIKALKESGKDSLLTCVRSFRFFWNKDGTPKNYDFMNRPRRQDWAGDLMENGAFYINSVGNILRDKNRLCGSIHVFEMPEYTATEIDEPDDWLVMEKLINKYRA